MMNPVQKAHQLGQAIWIDYICRGLLKSGEFQKLIGQVTANLLANGVKLFTDSFEKLLAGVERKEEHRHGTWNDWLG